ncbi:hypothetical protein R1flu_007864 [Riccia fluitans]|uniref:Uncharacterized protein n=1 Tax=Riccia fluitans TaxID=41844 RepID=A0ABD1Z0Z2_9MARC
MLKTRSYSPTPPWNATIISDHESGKNAQIQDAPARENAATGADLTQGFASFVWKADLTVERHDGSSGCWGEDCQRAEASACGGEVRG